MCERFDARTFETFLKKLLRHRSRGKRMVIVLDNARYHHAILLAPLLRKYRKVLTLLFLPPYSPQLAPIERVWKLARRLATHNRLFSTLGELLHAVESCFDCWRKPNAVLFRLCGII
jgi:transposase